jgi:alkyl sulfatase BDS1-like metallo-beta-lactamase superfamily hydrolase
MSKIFFKTITRWAIVFSLLSWICLMAACSPAKDEPEKDMARPDLLSDQCENMIGEPRVEQVSAHVWLAIGYDLASVILIHTPDGNIIVDTGMSPSRAEIIKKALAEKAPHGRIRAIIYTHSHIDHVGGASVWKEPDTRIWASKNFLENLFKQYALFGPIETIRGKRQFGEEVSEKELPCSAIGRKANVQAALESGLRLPTDTFSGHHTLNIGGLEIELTEAHGETSDQLFVWIPADKTLLAADNFYRAFPNLYTIRGTESRPVDAWIKALDAMRRKEAEHLVPQHTTPIHGKKEIADALTHYRDAIQWVRDDVVRRANNGEDLNSLAENIKLPAHLAGSAYTRELYGQVDWSAKGIYTGALGWFDGRAEALYPLAVKDAAQREIHLMGGPDKVLNLAEQAGKDGDFRWAIHLLTKLKDSGLQSGKTQKNLDNKLADHYENLASGIANTNGRGYLLQTAYELRNGFSKPKNARLSEDVVAGIPLDKIFAIMATKLITDKAMDVHESVLFIFPREKRQFVITVRKGVAEVVEGDALPGTPEPLAEVTMDELTFRKVATKLTSAAAAVASGKVNIKGSKLGYLKFMSRFRR